jgi:hypothetical protein
MVWKGELLLERDVRALALAFLRENSPQIESWQVEGLEEFSQAILRLVDTQSGQTL